MGNFSHTMHLLGRYPELAMSYDFQLWLRMYGGEVWHETPVDSEGFVTVVVQSANRLNLFAALIKRSVTQQKGVAESLSNEIVRTANINLADQELTPALVVSLVNKEAGVENSNIHAIRPVVDLRASEPVVTWEIEIQREEKVERFQVNNSKSLTRLEAVSLLRKEPEKLADDPIPPGNDWLEENECHHLSSWRTLAQQIIGGATAPADKAFAIWLAVRQRMSYDATITHINEFTWSDNLTINQNGWRGICDEWAVVQITLLRAVGVPAVLKFLIWKDAGHACVEWSDNGTWRHLDALWSAFDNRAVYRQNGAQPVSVMDASSPLDARYGGLAWGVLDVPGDQKFYPYGDFLINPSYPGNQRPGYSY